MSLRKQRPPGRGNRRGRSYAFTSLAPIRPSRLERLTAELERLADGPSPFGRVPSAHFARWLVIDGLKMGWPGAPRRPTQLTSNYLLFTAMVTVPARASAELPRDFLLEIAEAMPAEAAAVWRNCYAFPGVDEPSAFVDYLTQGQLDTELFYVGYETDVTPAEVRSAVDAHEAFLSFAATHQGETDAAALQRAFLEESPSWGN